MATPTSYLQTLAKDDAIAFIASVQKVQAHLSEELKWMTAQVQQKTTQLEGIEALLTEAVSLGLLESNDVIPPIATKTRQDATPAMDKESEVSPPDAPDTAESSEDELPVTESTSDAVSESPQVESTEPPTDPIALQPRRRGRTAAKQKGSVKAKSPKSSTRAASKKEKSAEGAELRQYLRPEFQDNTLMESIAQVLDQSSEPLETDEIMSALYESLSDEDYKRAKRSLANLLSVGRSKGRWQSTGRGRYVGKAVATA